MRSLTWRRTLRVIAVLSWIVAIAWLIVDPGFEPLLAFLTGAAAFLGSFAARESGLTREQRLRNRRAMLELVKSFWVKGVLEQSLHNAAMIELGMEEKPGAVEHPWDMVLQTDREDRALPAGTKILDVFDEMGGSLLILGEPGSGKTTMLLELARDTIARAEKNATQFIPVVFNLSSWAEKRQRIAEWLVEELSTKYNVPKRVARPWVENDDLLLLLDGLDEVKLEHGEACVKAINDFRQEHGLISLVVCSRIADYEALTTKLKLQGAVLLQPLTPQQVDEYLRGAGTALSAVRETLQHDPTLQELAETPLMLSVMTLAYGGMSVEEMGALGSVDDRRRHIFDAYVEQMFKRVGRTKTGLYCGERVRRSLAWLAKRMAQHAQTVFLIERIQPSWLETDAQRQLHNVVFGVLCSPILALAWAVMGAFIGLRSTPKAGLVVGLTFWLVIALIFAVSIAKADLKEVTPVALPKIRAELLRNVPKGELIGVLIAWGLSGAFACGAILYVLGFRELTVVLKAGAVSGLSMCLFNVLSYFLSWPEIETTQVPNQGIRESVRTCILAALVIGLLGGLTYGLITNAIAGPGKGLGVGLISGLVCGLMLGPIFGAPPVIWHYTLRFLLYCSGHIPWNLARFLDYASERIFLHKVGGGYIFIHRLLQDYFASLYQGQ